MQENGSTNELKWYWKQQAILLVLNKCRLSHAWFAYKAADLVISRAGASSISELCLLGKPVILVPSPNVAEDHQTKNAEALSSKGAAILVRDTEARQRLMPCALSVVHDEESLTSMSREIAALAQRDSAARIADIIFDIVNKK